MELTLCFQSSRFSTWPKIQDKNVNIMRTRIRWKAFFSIFKGFLVSKNFLRLESAPLMLWNSTPSGYFKLTVQIELALHPCNPFLINNRNTAGNIVEKQCFAVWNKTQNVLLTLKPNIYCFCLITFLNIPATSL